MDAGSPAHRPHLTAALLALLLTGVALAVALRYCEQLERRSIHALAPEFTAEKLQGVALQRQAFAQPDLLVLYGSSELLQPIPNNATEFFQEYPTGFRVFPVGKEGTTALAVLQKIGAVGEAVRGRKLAYSMSPGWFFIEKFDTSYYEGNFSDLQALELAFHQHLSHELKRDVARRMIAFPKTIEDRWLLDFTLRRLAGDTRWDRALYALIWPFGRLQSAVRRAQDHVESALHISEMDEQVNPEPRHGLRGLKWGEVLKKARQFVNASAVQAKRSEVRRKKLPRGSRNKAFLQAMQHASEWTDAELLMRTLRELGARPLLLSMPLEDIRLEVYGISGDAREEYHRRLNALAAKYQMPLISFRDHEQEPGFLVDFLDHLSGQGWLYYNKALDDFFHERLTGL